MDTIYNKCKSKMAGKVNDKGEPAYKIVFDVILLDSNGSDNLDGETPGSDTGLTNLAKFMAHLSNNHVKGEEIEYRMLLNPKKEAIADHDFMNFGDNQGLLD